VRNSNALALGIDGPAATACLTPAERRVCAALPSDARRRDWRAGRLAAKRAVRAAGLPAARLTVSIAHVAGRAAAVAALAPGRVGIDLERAGSVRPAQARYFLTRAERRLARRLGLTVLWTLKEAAWKALRADDATPFLALEVHAGPRGDIESVSLHDRRHGARALVARPWPGFVLAVLWVLEER
jgi:4'-phosphopantetheinyl transferase EntD